MIPGVFEIPSYFEPTFFKRDSYIADKLCNASFGWTAELSVAVAHLALLGLKVEGDGTLGFFKL